MSIFSFLSRSRLARAAMGLPPLDQMCRDALIEFLASRGVRNISADYVTAEQSSLHPVAYMRVYYGKGERGGSPIQFIAVQDENWGTIMAKLVDRVDKARVREAYSDWILDPNYGAKHGCSFYIYLANRLHVIEDL